MKIFTNGDRYEGYFKNNRINGWGKYYYSDGHTYEGYIQNGAVSEYGKYCFADGTIYKGKLVNEKKEGYGIEVRLDGSRYEGTFRNDVRAGYGTYYLPNGFKYVGNFRSGSCHGYGILYWSNGKEACEGRWVLGGLIDDKDAKYWFADGTKATSGEEWSSPDKEWAEELAGALDELSKVDVKMPKNLTAAEYFFM